MMRRQLSLLAPLCLAIVFGCVTMGFAQSKTIYVVCGEGVSLTAKDVKDVFTGRKTFSGATPLVPVGNAAGVREFLDRIVGMSATQFEALWSKKAFLDGVNAPKLLMSDMAVINFVQRTPGAVGYVSTPPTGVTIVQTY